MNAEDSYAAARDLERSGAAADVVREARQTAARQWLEEYKTQPYSEWVRHCSCTSKRAYGSLWEANLVVLYHWRQGQRGEAYKCPYADEWHVTTHETDAAS